MQVSSYLIIPLIASQRGSALVQSEGEKIRLKCIRGEEGRDNHAMLT